MGEFNSDDHYIYYCGQESLRRNGVAIIVNKKSEMQYLDTISKMTEWSLFVSKTNHSISRWSKPMPQPVTLKKLKLNGSMGLWRSTRAFRTNTAPPSTHQKKRAIKTFNLNDFFLIPWLYPLQVYSHLDQAVFARDCQKVDPGHRQVLCCHAAKKEIWISHWLAAVGHLQPQQCL